MALQNFGGSLPSHRNLFHYANRLFLPLRRVDETSGERGGFGGNAGRDGGNRIDFDQRERRVEISNFYSFIRFDYIHALMYSPSPIHVVLIFLSIIHYYFPPFCPPFNFILHVPCNSIQRRQ